MIIPRFATCSTCEEWCEDRCNTHVGTCGVAEFAAKEAMIQDGMSPMSIKVTIAWNAKPCPQWSPSQKGQREIDILETDQRSIEQAERRVAL